MKSSNLKTEKRPAEIKALVSAEIDRTGGIFRVSPTWVARPGIIQPGRRIKLRDEYLSKELAVNERWFTSVTYADNGVYNKMCPPDHGLSYLIIGDRRVLLRDALELMESDLLSTGTWKVLPKFFDNRNRIPHHLHPCDDHLRPGLIGKPESYHFPTELNLQPNDFPYTAVGVDRNLSDKEIRAYFHRYFSGDNRLTDISLTYNLVPGTGWFMPPCTLHAPGSLVTYELQTASDVSCIAESRVNDMVMPSDMVDRDLPVTVEEDGLEALCDYLVAMVHCPNSGNLADFRKEYFRPPVTVLESSGLRQDFVIYRCGRASESSNPDLYSAKHTTLISGARESFKERAAFGLIVLGGHGILQVEGREAVVLESAGTFEDRDEIAGDEVFVSADAARHLKAECRSIQTLSFYQHFSANSNPESTQLPIPQFEPFGAR